MNQEGHTQDNQTKFYVLVLFNKADGEEFFPPILSITVIICRLIHNTRTKIQYDDELMAYIQIDFLCPLSKQLRKLIVALCNMNILTEAKFFTSIRYTSTQLNLFLVENLTESASPRVRCEIAMSNPP